MTGSSLATISSRTFSQAGCGSKVRPGRRRPRYNRTPLGYECSLYHKSSISMSWFTTTFHFLSTSASSNDAPSLSGTAFIFMPPDFIRFQEEAVVGVVVEEILRQDGTTEGILQGEEVALPVWISVGVVLPELVPGKPERCGPLYRQSASRSPAVWPREV